MDINIQLTELVRQMRSAQKKYFRTRTKEALNESMRLERSVDLFLDKSNNNGERFCSCSSPLVLQFDSSNTKCDDCGKVKF